MRGITASTNDIPAASGKRQLFSVGRLITPASFGKAASVILSALLVMGFVSGPLLSNRQAHAAGAFCNCVVMRTDDYQDYWLHTVASSLVQLFVDKKTIQTTGLIMNAFGNDSVIVNKVKQAVSSGNAELAVHGWDHVDFSQMSLSQQNSAIHNATNKMMSMFGKTSRIFLPPYNLFNNNTLSAMKSNGYTIFSADKFTDTYPYAPSRDSFGVMHIPSTIETGYINANGHWSLNDNSQIIAALDADVASQGYAVLTIHPQQYAILSGGQEADVINQTRWNQLSDIIDNMKSKHNIVGFSTIESVYSSSQSIFINPWNGPAGTPVTIVGSGFAANSPSKIYFDGKQVSTVTTNSSGGISPGTATFAVPLPYPSGSKQVMVTDANGAGNSATTAFTIVNSAPVANGSRILTLQNTAAAVSLGASDANNDPLTYSIVSAPSHGTLAGVAPSLIYTPASNYVGTDSFAFKANDGTADSNIATISINVTYSSSISANPQSLSTYQNVQKSILLTGSGGSGKPLSFSLVNSPVHGSLYGTPPDLTYTPSLNYLGPDSFSFTVSNDTSTSSPATVTLTVSPPVTYPVIRMSDTVKSGATSIFGQKLLASEFVSAGSALVGKQFDSITIGLSKSGTPTGTAQVGVFGADLSEKKSFGTKDVSTLTTTSTDYTFQLASNDLYTIQSGDYIGVEYSGGSASSYVLVMRDWTNNFDGVNSYRAYYNGIWNNVTGDDMYMLLKQTHG